LAEALKGLSELREFGIHDLLKQFSVGLTLHEISQCRTHDFVLGHTRTFCVSGKSLLLLSGEANGEGHAGMGSIMTPFVNR